MNQSMSKILLTALMACCGFAIASSPAMGQTPATTAATAPKPAEQQFKNILVMKGTPADQLIPAMQFISASLGVECEFCHVEHAMEKDDKKAKLTARSMIEMQMAINKAHFKGNVEVTCNTCHRGAERPVGVPVIADEEPKRPETPAAASATPGAAPTPVPADPILEKYLQAVGGADALQKITSRVQKGTISFGERKFPVDVVAKAPNKRITTAHTANGDNVTAYDGHAGWLGNPGGRPPRDMTAQENEAVSFDATFYLPLDIRKMFTQFRVRPVAEKIGGHEVVQLIGIREGKPPQRFFFDKESGLLLRTVRYAETPLGRNPTQVDYADYRAEGGVKIPFQWTIARPQGRFTIQVNEVQQNVAIDDAVFAKPAAPAEKPVEKK
jgi:photosynthetic reaction center cytochrome c subunit